MTWRTVSMREALLWAQQRGILHEEIEDGVDIVHFHDGSALKATAERKDQFDRDPYADQIAVFEIGEP